MVFVKTKFGIVMIAVLFATLATENAFADNTYSFSYKGILVEDNWNNKAQGMIKIISFDNMRSVLMIENFVANSEDILNIFFTSEDDPDNRMFVGNIDSDSMTHFYEISENTILSEYDTILITDPSYSSIIYGSAAITEAVS